MNRKIVIRLFVFYLIIGVLGYFYLNKYYFKSENRNQLEWQGEVVENKKIEISNKVNNSECLFSTDVIVIEPKVLTNDFVLAIQLIEKMQLTDTYQNNVSPFINIKNSAKRFRDGLNGKISGDHLVCRDLVNYFLYYFGDYYGYYALTIDDGSEKHIVYLTYLKLKKGNCWCLISWNSFFIMVSEPEENLLDFVERLEGIKGKYLLFVTIGSEEN